MRRIVSRATWLFRNLLARTRSSSDVGHLYKSLEYLDAYSAHTDARVENDPKGAVGGLWDELGPLQFDFLIDQGLKSTHRLLDIGCGTLRGGRLFIQYLDEGNYYGIDISRKAIEHALAVVSEAQLSSKRPNILLNHDKDLTFAQFEGLTFDYLLAQSVFTHLPPPYIEECFRHVGKVMGSRSAFYFTIHEAPVFTQTGLKDFRYPVAFFEELCRSTGFDVCNLSGEYDHPRGQLMLKATKKRGEAGFDQLAST